MKNIKTKVIIISVAGLAIGGLSIAEGMHRMKKDLSEELQTYNKNMKYEDIKIKCKQYDVIEETEA